MALKQRLDLELLTRGLVSSRQQAQQLIRAGKVRDGAGTVLDKPGAEVRADQGLVVETPPRFVSRGGEKLLAGLEAFPLDVRDRVCLDGGISTGGFTDCLLQHGARRVYGVDVGYGQTAWSLRTDDRVVLREGGEPEASGAATPAGATNGPRPGWAASTGAKGGRGSATVGKPSEEAKWVWDLFGPVFSSYNPMATP